MFREIISELLVLLAASSASAQNGSQFKDWVAPARDARVVPKIACRELRSLIGYEFSIATADLVPAASDVPEHCLPSSWNRHFYMFGNFGFARESFDVPPRVAHRSAALKRGFAVASTGTGYDAAMERLASFATDRSLHVTATRAKRIVRDGASPGQGSLQHSLLREIFSAHGRSARILRLRDTKGVAVWTTRRTLFA